MWEGQELLSAFLCSLGAGPHQVQGRLKQQRWTGLPLSGGSGSRAGSWTGFRVEGLISCCFLILDFLEEAYGCFMSFLYSFKDLFLAVLSLRCERAFSSCSEQGPLLVEVLTGFSQRRLCVVGSSHMAFAALHHVESSWTRIRPVCRALSGRLSTTGPPGSPSSEFPESLDSPGHSSPPSQGCV